MHTSFRERLLYCQCYVTTFNFAYILRLNKSDVVWRLLQTQENGGFEFFSHDITICRAMEHQVVVKPRSYRTFSMSSGPTLHFKRNCKNACVATQSLSSQDCGSLYLDVRSGLPTTYTGNRIWRTVCSNQRIRASEMHSTALPTCSCVYGYVRSSSVSIFCTQTWCIWVRLLMPNNKEYLLLNRLPTMHHNDFSQTSFVWHATTKRSITSKARHCIITYKENKTSRSNVGDTWFIT